MCVVRGGRARRISFVGLALALGLMASGCSGDLFGSSRPAPSPPSAGGTSGSSGSFSDRMNAFFFGPYAATGDPANPNTPRDAFDCPGVEVRSGASTLAVGPPGAEATVTNMRYQASIARTARECPMLGATMTIKVGLQGRVILGPTGGPGQIDVPIRLAVVREGVEPK